MTVASLLASSAAFASDHAVRSRVSAKLISRGKVLRYIQATRGRGTKRFKGRVRRVRIETLEFAKLDVATFSERAPTYEDRSKKRYYRVLSALLLEANEGS